MVDGESKTILEVADVAVELVVVSSYGCRWEELLLCSYRGQPWDIKVKMMHALWRLLQTPYLIS